MNFAELQHRYASSPDNSRNNEESTLLGRATLSVAPEESVYGAIMFLPGISRLKDGYEWNRPAKLAIFLCLLNALLQMGVVQVINIYDHAGRLQDIRMLLPEDEVVERGGNVFGEADKKAEEEAGKAEGTVHRAFLPPHEKAELKDIHEIEPLCKRIGDGNGTFTCMPHSVMFVNEWKNLDTDGDGVWTIEEARADINNLRAKRHVSPETIFNNLINGLRLQAAFIRDEGLNKTLYLSPDIQHERAIPEAYFNFWKGDAMMCGLFDSNSCEAAARSGVFSSALAPGRVSAQAKGIHDLDSAIQYCYRMLQDGGGCEALLPMDFKRNREQRWERCGARSLVEGGKYVNPYDPEQSVHVLEATYAEVNAYQRATSRLFLFFLSLVIVLWLLSLVDEWREILKLGEFLIVYPGIPAGERGGAISPRSPRDVDTSINSKSEVMYRIDGIGRKHRAMLVIVFFVRLMVVSMLSQFGTRFLLVETDYLALVMNSLALTFILTIDAMLFDLVEADVKDALNHCKPLSFITRLPTEGWWGYFLKKECWGLIAVPVLSVCIVLHYNWQNKEPILTVLRCACTQEGSKCLDSMTYQAGWWKDYWVKSLPAAMHQIEALRLNQYEAIGMTNGIP